MNFMNGMTIEFNGVKRTLNRYKKYGCDRVYINKDNGSSEGYVDLKSGRPIGTNSYEYCKKIVEAILTMEF